MKVSLNYEECIKVLSYANTILADKGVDDKAKNVIFSVTPDKVAVTGCSIYAFARTSFEKAEIDIEEEELWEFQVRVSNLNKILASFSSLSKTKVTGVELCETKGKINVIITEEAIEEEDSRLNQKSSFLLDILKIDGSMLKEIHTEFPSDVESIISSDLLLYLNSLYPLLSKESGLAGTLTFADDYVFLISSYLTAFIQNRLPDAFKGCSIRYSCVSFIKKLLESSDSVDVGKFNSYLCVESGNTQAFLKFAPIKKFNHKRYVDNFKKDNGIVLDRKYLKDVLKRLSINGTDAKMYVDGENLVVANKDFTQLIPIIKVKGDVKDLRFTISVPIIEKVIIGDDGVFDGELFLYFSRVGSSYTMYVSDKSGAWFAQTQAQN